MTPAQRRAGLAAMSGTFKHKDVRQALQRAGVEIEKLSSTTSALLQEEREAGRIRHETLEGKPVTENDQWVKVRV